LRCIAWLKWLMAKAEVREIRAFPILAVWLDKGGAIRR